MYDLEAAKEENLRAQKALNDMQDLLSLIVSVSSEQVPQLKSDINIGLKIKVQHRWVRIPIL